MRVGITVLLVIHGAIHLLGFLKWTKLAAVPQLGGQTLFALPGAAGHLFGWLWLIALLGFFAAAALRIAQLDAWWPLALASTLLSQAIIVVAWQDAKVGTVANVLIALAIIVSTAKGRFERGVVAEIQALLAQAPVADSTIVKAEELERLPPVVRRWLERSGVVGHLRAQVVRLKQQGDLRTSPTGQWLPAQAEQYFRIDEPAFLWRVRTRMWRMPIAGRDMYVAGAGQMLIKAAWLINVVAESDKKIAQGALLRFLGEVVWFPSAALRSYIEWAAVDDTSAKATLRHAGLSVSALFIFDKEGRVTEMRAERFLGGGPSAKLTPWSVSCTAWRVVRGIEIPVRGDVRWRLPSGDFSYYRWEIVDVEYNCPQIYGERMTRDEAP